MLKYQKWVMPLIILSTVALSGCTNSRNTISLIQTPLLANEKQNEIKETLVKLLPEAWEFVVPGKSEHKQSIFIDDINKDGKEEAFALYQNIKENHQVHLLVLQEDNKKWNRLQDLNIGFKALDFF